MNSAKYRNTFGTTWRKELWITNVKPATSGTALLRVSADGALLSVPWQSQGGDGRLAVFPAATVGKLPSPPATIAAHKGALVDVCWSPFRARVATVAREPVAKVWDVPPGGLARDAPAALAAALPHPACRAVSARWHPHVDGLMLTTGSDNALHIWDLSHLSSGEGAAELSSSSSSTSGTTTTPAATLALSTEPHPDAVQSAEWDGEHGSLVVTASKDACVRLWDVRAGRGAVACEACRAGAAHGAKGFVARFLEHRGMVLTLGVDGKGDRTLVLRDTRALGRVLASVAVDSGNPYPLEPLYDASTGVLYLASRGTVTYAYEVHAIAPFALPVGRIASRTNHSAVCMAPKTVCDVLRCETARLYALTVGGTIEPVSISVQRKAGARAVFHEDLFPPAPSTAPAPVSPAAWLDPAAHVLTAPQLVSLQPPGVPSIFDIPAADGGKSREQDEHRTATISTLAADPAAAAALATQPPVTEGTLLFTCPPRGVQGGEQEQQHEGDPSEVETATTTPVPRFVKLVHGRIYVFADEESPSSIAWIDANDIVDVVDCAAAAADPGAVTDSSAPAPAPGAFTVVTCEEDGVEYPFVADSEGAKLAWIRSIRSLATAAQKAALSESESETDEPEGDDEEESADESAVVHEEKEGNDKEEETKKKEEKEEEVSTPAVSTLEVKTPAASPVPGRRGLCLSAVNSPRSSRRSPSVGRRRTYSSSRSPLPLNAAAAIQSVMYAFLPDTGTDCAKYEFSVVDHILYRARILDDGKEEEKKEENPLAHSVRLPTTSLRQSEGQQEQEQPKKETGTVMKEKAVEVCHLERILGIVETTGVFEESLGGASFKVITASCALHLLASCADVRARWVRALSRGRLEARNRGVFDVRDKAAAQADGPAAADDAYFGGEDLEPEDLVLDGPVTVLRSSSEGSSEGEGEGERQQHWTSVLEDLFVYADARACVPLAHRALGTIDSVQAVDNSDPRYEATDFEVTFVLPSEAATEGGEGAEATNKKTITLCCRCESEGARDMWVDGLEEKRKRAVDILGELGLDEAGVRKAAAAAARARCVTMADVTCGRHRLLLQVGGRRRTRVWNAEVSWRALNPHSAFVLDAGAALYVWNGALSSRVVRGKAFDLANRVRTHDRGAHPQLVTLLQGSPAERACAPFWEALGRSLEDVEAEAKALEAKAEEEAKEAAANEGPQDSKTKSKTKSKKSTPMVPPPPPGVVYATPAEQDAEARPIVVYRVGPHRAKPRYHRVQLVAETTDRAPPSCRQCLHRNNAYVVDCGTELYVWLGRLAADDQRDLALALADRLLAQPRVPPRPAWAVVLRVPQGAEPALFREKFCDFPGTTPLHSSGSGEGGASSSTSNIAHGRTQQSVEAIVRAMQVPAPLETIPEGLEADEEPSGTVVRMWRVEAYRAHAYPAALAGHFFSGDAFVVLYTYRVHARPRHVLYFWQGRDCRNSERGVSAMLARDVAAALGDDPVAQVRLVQGKESLHFVRVFARGPRGAFVVHKGHYTAYCRAAPHLLEVRHRPPFPCRAVETALSAAALNSRHAFLLLEPARHAVTAWLGCAADAEERAFVRAQLDPETAVRWAPLFAEPAPDAGADDVPVSVGVNKGLGVGKDDEDEEKEEAVKEDAAPEEVKDETREDVKEEAAPEDAPQETKEETEVAPEEAKKEEAAPEETSEETKEEKEEDVKEEVAPEAAPEEKKEEAQEETKEEVEAVKEEIKEDTKEETKEEVAPEEVKEEAKEEVKEEIKEEVKEDVAPEEAKEEVKEEATEETKEVKEETKEETKEDVEIAPQEAKEEFKEEVKKEEAIPEEKKEETKEESKEEEAQVAPEEAKEEVKEEKKEEVAPEETKEDDLTCELLEEEKEEEEGESLGRFFEVLGGKQAYYEVSAGEADSPVAHNPRLFCLAHTSGAVEVDEEPSPSEDDLVAGGTFIVDAFRAVYVWMRSKTAVRTVRRLALAIAIEYVHQSAQQHAPDTPVLVVEAFHEPADFCAQFHAWSKNRHAVPRGENLDVVVPAQAATAVLEAEFSTRYTLAELTGHQLPKGVDPLALEQYLTDEDFEKTFKMGRADFARLKKWQQDDLKRACGLF